MENKLFYPALFHKSEKGGFWVSFPDFPECFTDGESVSLAYEMAFDALGLCITGRMADKEDLPEASSPESITLEPDSFIVLVEFDLAAYNKKHNSKAVKKTLTIPGWLDEEAVAKNINFSQVLQEALIERLHG